MLGTPLDVEIDRITAELARCSPTQVAAFSASCAERMAILYREFSMKEGWGSYATLRRVLDNVWSHLAGHVSVDALADAEASITSVTPNDEDFRSLECLLAQNACICADLAVQLCLRRPPGDGRQHAYASQYSLEAVRAAVSVSQTGYLDLGDHPSAVAFEASLLNDPRIQREVALQWEDVADITAAAAINEVLVVRLRQRAERSYRS